MTIFYFERCISFNLDNLIIRWMPKKINLKINFLRFVGEMVSVIRDACMIYRSSSGILEIAELYYLSTVDPPFGLISRCFISKSSFSISSRCAHHRLVPSIFPTEKIPISRRYDNLASASFPPSDLSAMLLSSFLEKYFSPRLCYAKRINFAWPPLRLNRASLNRFTVY